MQYYDSILGLIGNTPLVRLNKIAKNVKPIMLLKLESLNPGGSVKERIEIAMIETAENHLKGLGFDPGAPGCSQGL